VKRTVKRTATQLAPSNVAGGAMRKVRQRSRDVGDAVREGRDAMRTRERELRARRDGRVETLDDQLGPDDQLLVDGQPVETARVIVLRRAK
jgi:Sec-independent protein translocase protein TatA